jgi:hypothetical protein
MKQQTNPVWKFIKGLDSAGNGLCGGNEDETISGKIGYFAGLKGYSPWWMVLEKVVNTTFFPPDGFGHCKQSIEMDEAKPDPTLYNLVMTTVLVFIFCPIIFIATWGLVAPYKAIKFVWGLVRKQWLG